MKKKRKIKTLSLLEKLPKNIKIMVKKKKFLKKKHD